MDQLLNQFQQEGEKAINFLKEDLKTIRTGRANPSLVENLIIEAYHGQSKLKLFELATITTEGPTTIIITPFDPTITSDIEKAIFKSPLSLTPQTQSNKIIIRLPPLSTEQREKFIKLLNQKIEEKKIVIRNLRDDTRKKIRQAYQEKSISEDIKFRLEKEVDNITQKLINQIESLHKTKKEEISQI